MLVKKSSTRVRVASTGISNKGDLPDGTTYTWKDTPDTTTPGDKSATVVVTYPDGTTDEVPVTVHVNSQADQNDPKGQDIDVNKGETPNPADGISNKGDLPDGTTYTCKDGQTPDTTTPGNKDATVVVTYPDGSTDEVPVTVHVTDPTNPSTDADKNTPQPQPITVKEGETPNTEDGIANKGDLPDGTKNEWKDTPDVSKPGDTTGTIVVTYPDGSQDFVTVTIHVNEPSGQTTTTTATTNGNGGNTTQAATGAKQAPAKALPQTGNEDTTNMSVLGLTFASLFGALGALGLRKKKEDK